MVQILLLYSEYTHPKEYTYNNKNPIIYILISHNSQSHTIISHLHLASRHLCILFWGSIFLVTACLCTLMQVRLSRELDPKTPWLPHLIYFFVKCQVHTQFSRWRLVAPCPGTNALLSLTFHLVEKYQTDNTYQLSIHVLLFVKVCKFGIP